MRASPAIQLLRTLPFIFWFGVLFVTVLALIPSTAVPQAINFWDKAQHALAFAVLALTGYLAYPAMIQRVGIGLVAHGALIEIVQATLTTTRFGDAFDWLADTIGVVTAFILYAAWRFTRQRR